jgi:aryl-phospho-beta-D-glucosidase BglC (GH1 family)
MRILKTAVNWFAARGLYVILDMHAVPGCQNRDWHSDSEGEMDFYTNSESRERYIYLWKELSAVFKDEKWVAAYDIMNEPVVRDPEAGCIKALPGGGLSQTGNPELEVLKEAFRAVVNAVRDSGDQHIIFLEGHQWAQRVEFLADIIRAPAYSGNVAISAHFYEPTDLTFNTNPDLHYPGEVDGKLWDRAAVKQYLSKYAQYEVPVYIGEFGACTTCAFPADKYRWVEDVVSVMCELEYHWTYWTYKSVAGMPFPDGLFQFFEPKNIFAKDTDHAGMKNIGRQLLMDKGCFYDFLETKNFKLNQKLLTLLL